jgi:hypothetical protein
MAKTKMGMLVEHTAWPSSATVHALGSARSMREEARVNGAHVVYGYDDRVAQTRAALRPRRAGS